jgi:hypothetical protein
VPAAPIRPTVDPPSPEKRRKEFDVPKFMLILHMPPGLSQKSSPEDLQRMFEKYRAWVDKMRSADRLVGSDKLAEEGGRVITAQQGRVSVVEGPYSEAKEVVGGYMMIRAADYEEAVSLVSDHPHLSNGRIELRQTDEQGCSAG